MRLHWPLRVARSIVPYALVLFLVCPPPGGKPPTASSPRSPRACLRPKPAVRSPTSLGKASPCERRDVRGGTRPLHSLSTLVYCSIEPGRSFVRGRGNMGL